MSDDPIQAIVDKLDAIEKGVSSLTVNIRAMPQASAVSTDAIERAAERGASNAAYEIADNVNSLRRVAANLEIAIIPAEAAVKAYQELPKVQIPAMVLVALLGLSVSFIGGVFATRAGLLLTTQTSCEYLGGTWSPRQDNSEFVCWR